MRVFLQSAKTKSVVFFQNKGYIWGTVQRETNECFILKDPNRNAATLVAQITNNIAQRTTIFSDAWKSYKTDELVAARFQHFQVSHRYNFVNPETGAHIYTKFRTILGFGKIAKQETPRNYP